MAEIVTNGELYAAVLQLLAQHRENPRSLAQYLMVLWGIGFRNCDRSGFTLDEFFRMLDEAFSAEQESFTADILDDADLTELEQLETHGYDGWEYRIARQIIDLQEMTANGQLEDKFRYFGIDAPRGSRWYNFTPAAFLERATSGTFIDSEDDETVPLCNISWEQFRDFLGAGQAYE